MKKGPIAIISASGFLGAKIFSVFKSHGFEIIPTYFPQKPGEEGVVLNVLDKEAVADFVKKYSPAAVINCSAMADVDWCELHEEDCFKVNVEGVKNLALACKATETKLVHFSTAFVFDGKRTEKYCEDDTAKAVNIYGESKIESEKVVKETLEDFLILRCLSRKIFIIPMRLSVFW